MNWLTKVNEEPVEYEANAIFLNGNDPIIKVNNQHMPTELKNSSEANRK